MVTTFKELNTKMKTNPLYWGECIKFRFMSQICLFMHRQGITRKDLAVKLNTNQSYITKLLNGNAKLSSDVMGKLLQVLDLDIEIRLKPQGDRNDTIKDNRGT